jgi:hypothetical protein
MWYCFLPFALLSHCPSPGKFQLLFAGVCFKKMGGSLSKSGVLSCFFSQIVLMILGFPEMLQGQGGGGYEEMVKMMMAK